MQLDQVVPFGRSHDEYVAMFALTAADRQQSILGVGDGPASFNAEGTQLGDRIQSVDPIYELSAAQIRDRFEAVVDHIIQQVINTPDDWVWTYHRSPADLRQRRERALHLFCEDFEQGKAEGRYTVGQLPSLPYADQSYDLGLCSHFLFLYSDQCDRAFHQASLRELLRICREVRIFPLLTLNGTPSPHLADCLADLETAGYTCTIQTVAYELQRGGNQLLRVTRPT